MMDASDYSSVKTVRVHREQFDAINSKSNSIIVTCIEDGRCITFNRENENRHETQPIYPTSFNKPYVKECELCRGLGMIQIAPNVNGMKKCPVCKGYGKVKT